MSNAHDHREFTRISTTLDADLVIAGRIFPGTTRDVSLKGLLVSLVEPMAINDACTVTIYLDGRTGEAVIRGEGRIARIQPGACAVELTTLNEPESYQHLANLIRYNARDVDQVASELDSHLGLKRIMPSGDV